MLSEAIQYLTKHKFSVIPVQSDKRPYVKWAEFQQRHPTREEVEKWWGIWPDAMIGIVTGSISGLFAIDCDTQEGYEAVQKYMPDSLIFPLAKTPRGGWHLYFLMPTDHKLTVGTAIVPGVDYRGEGGYIIAPPSQNSRGAYTWQHNLSLDHIEPPALPPAVIDYINNSIKYKCDVVSANKRQKVTTIANNFFTKGRRDEDLFHVANCLIKGGMQPDYATYTLNILAVNCKPPFPLAEAQDKIKSALERAKRRERNLTQEIREWVLTTNGTFLTTEVYNGQHLTTRAEKKKAQVILGRLVEEGILERTGNKNGCYRIIDRECEDIDFLNASDTPFDIRWPFGIEALVQTMPGNIIVIAGEPNAGKTAFLLNLVKENMRQRTVYYFSSEMGPMEMRKRLGKFDIPLNDWQFHAKERTSNFGDVIKPDAINIIDFLEVYDEFYKIGGMIKEIYDKLDRGIAVIAIQKNRGTDYGLGGGRGLEKARLYLTMAPGKVKIIKAKNWRTTENPNGLERDFKLAGGCKFYTDRDWHRP